MYADLRLKNTEFPRQIAGPEATGPEKFGDLGMIPQETHLNAK